MNTQSLNELQDFHRFVGDKVNNGGASMSPEQALEEWRILHPDTEALRADTAALQEAIDDLENGEIGIPFEEFERDFRKRHNLPDRS